jgi:hypothetical protein
MANLSDPPASEDEVVHADWLELKALKSADNSSSIQDLVQVFRRAGTAEAIEEDDQSEYPQDRGAERTQSVAEDAFSEIEDRHQACGGDLRVYPFHLEPQHIEMMGNPEISLYFFLLLLSYFGKDVGPRGTDAAKLFERVSVHAAETYFGGPQANIQSYCFGFPRRSAPRSFIKAVDDLCQKMGEGQGCRLDRPSVKGQKDAKLDLAVWRQFHDNRVGKLIGFGQCATGNNWKDKLTELQPNTFCNMWMRESPSVDPVRMFFVPFRIERHYWMDAARQGGIVFDRCRIAIHCRDIDEHLKGECSVWTAHVLREKIRS